MAIREVGFAWTFVWACAAVCWSCGAQRVIAEPTIGQFELKDLEAEPGRIEFQSQNAHSWGQPNRRFAEDDDDETVFDDNAVSRRRHALELEAALTHFMRARIGIEYEQERIEDPKSIAQAEFFNDLKLDEIAFETVLIFVPVKERNGVGVGLLVEYEHPFASGELDTIIFGPIFEAQYGRWSAVTNLLLVKSFGEGEVTDEGLERDDKLDFAYAAQVMYEVSENWSLALEAYGTVDRLGRSGMPGEEREFFGDHDQHRIGPIVYYRNEIDGLSGALEGRGEEGGEEGTVLTVGTGVLVGLNKNTPDATLKWSVEVEF